MFTETRVKTLFVFEVWPGATWVSKKEALFSSLLPAAAHCRWQDLFEVLLYFKSLRQCFTLRSAGSCSALLTCSKPGCCPSSPVLGATAGRTRGAPGRFVPTQERHSGSLGASAHSHLTLLWSQVKERWLSAKNHCGMKHIVSGGEGGTCPSNNSLPLRLRDDP